MKVGHAPKFRYALVFYDPYKQPDAEQVRASKWRTLRIIYNKINKYIYYEREREREREREIQKILQFEEILYYYIIIIIR